MPIKGMQNYAGQDPLQRSAYRTSIFAPEGAVGALVLECQVIDLNLTNWTVDTITKFDNKKYFNIQVSSPYMHWNRGEGLFVMPDIGAKCHVCIPSEGSPPYLLDFIMPMESVPQAGTEDAPDGTNSSGGPGQFPSDATFAGGRVRAKPGDIIMRGRDGSFMVLHKGGVLQIGATPLAQRIYIPLQNLITDISQNYDHLNTGGSIKWYVNQAESDDNPSTIHRHTLRLLANDEKASLRISMGKLNDVVADKDSTATSDLSQMGFGAKKDISVCEVVLSPDGFNAHDGTTTSDAAKNTKLRFFFDKNGNCMLRTEGSLYLRAKGRVRARVDDDVEIFGKKNFTFNFDGSGRLQAKAALDIVGGVITFNGGNAPIATVGSTTTSSVNPGSTFMAIVPPLTAPQVCTIVAFPPISGTVDTGNPTLLG